MRMTTIGEIFREGGVLSKLNPAYKERPIQIEATAKIDELLNSDKKAFVLEGECGSGKSYMYLMTTLNKIAQNGFNEKLVIVTSNISLQEQLAYRDVPFAMKVIKELYPEAPADFKGVLFKGRQNFACNKKVSDLIADSFVDGYELKNDKQFRDVINWTYDTKKGDLSELSFIPDMKILENIACLDADECIGRKKCEFGQQCYYGKHKQDIDDASVIITNYHMLFSDLKLGGSILPKYDYIVFDECHELADIYRDFKTISLSLGTIRWMSKKIKEMLKKDADLMSAYTKTLDMKNLEAYTEKFLIDIKETYCKSKYDDVLLLDNIDMSKAPDSFDLSNEIDNIISKLEFVMENLAEKINYVSEEVGVNLSQALNIAATLVEKLDKISLIVRNMNKEFVPSDTDIDWIDYKAEKDEVTLNTKPLSVAKDMVDCFYAEENLKCIFASATISVGGSMDYFKEQVGLNLIDSNLSDVFIGPSPFNMKEQQLWYLPSNAVEGNKTFDFNKLLPTQVSATIKACRGGVLCLFTSYKNMKDTYDNVKYDLPRGIKVLKQGDAPRLKLLDQFKDDSNSVLFATRSFFTGVDVPGESLRCLIIDKLPFPQPSDPVQQKLSTQKDSFFKYSIPMMIITLKQAVGRGVRSADDKCVICILDNRMATARYKGRIAKSFNYDKTSTRDISVVEDFIDNYIPKEEEEEYSAPYELDEIPF